jgi:hypothetical protein
LRQRTCQSGTFRLLNMLSMDAADVAATTSTASDLNKYPKSSLSLVSKDDCFLQSSSPSYMAPEVLSPQPISPSPRHRSIWQPGLFPIYQSTTIGASDGFGSNHEPNSEDVSSMTTSQGSVDDIQAPTAYTSFLCSFRFTPYLSSTNYPISLPRFRAEGNRKKSLALRLRRHLPRILELIDLHGLRETTSASKDLSDIFYHQNHHINEIYSTDLKVNRMNSFSGTALAVPWFRIRHRARIRAAQWHTSIQ